MTSSYIFKELDKRALIGLLTLELVHDIKFKPAQSPGALLETYVRKSPEGDVKVSGFFTIINHLNNKLSASTDDVDFTWKVRYGISYFETVIKNKKASTKARINRAALLEVEEALKKTPFLGGKKMGELDIVLFMNINDIVAQELDQYTKEAPAVVKLLNTIKEPLTKSIEAWKVQFPPAEKKDAKKPEGAADEKKGDAKAATDKKGDTKAAPADAKKADGKKADAKAPQEETKKDDKPKKEEKAKKDPKAPEQKKETVKAEPKAVKPKVIDPEVAEILKKCKINRLTKGKVILPSKTKRNILITSALPYVNNVPHLGNIIGCVLSADVYSRWARLRGYNTIYICGTDEYGTATETKALSEGKTPKEICDYYHQIHKAIYEWFDIDFDYFGRTTTPHHTEIAQEIFKDIKKNDLLVEDVLHQPHCAKCDRFLADRYVRGTCPHCKYEDATGDQCDKCGKLLDPADLINPKCQVCKEAPKIQDTKHLFLNLPVIEPDLEKFIAKNSKPWTSNSTQITRSWIKQGLKPRCITRDLKWGVPVPAEGYEKKVFYVWFDAPIGYISITANYTDQWRQWWQNPENVELYQFMGKDNVPFHTVIFPSSLLATKQNWTILNNISTTEYLNYERGLKFSKSRGTGVFGDSAAATSIPSEVWRYQLLINRPEASDSEFDWDDFSTKVNNELVANPGNLCNRILKLIYEKYEKKVPEFDLKQLNDSDLQALAEIWTLFGVYNSHFEAVEIKAALKTAMEISTVCNKYMQDQKPWDKVNVESKRSHVVLGVLANLIRFVSLIFEPFMPSFSAKINYILGRETRTEEDEVLIEALIAKNDCKLLATLLPSAQVLNKVVPLFDLISSAEVEEYRNKFNTEKTA